MKKLFLTMCSILVFVNLQAQNIGMNATGASADPSAMLDISSTNSGLLIPRMTTLQRAAIATPATGLFVYDTDLSAFYFFNGVLWQPFTTSSTGWNTIGNTSTIASTNFIGTTDAVDFVTRTNNLERMRVTSAGNVGIGNPNPNAPLQFASLVGNRKIVLFEATNNDHQFLGFGINGSILRYQVDQASANHVFYAGSGATTSNELMRIQGNGDVGIGTSSPTQRLHVAGGNALLNNTLIGDIGFGALWSGLMHTSVTPATGYALLTSGDGAYTLINKENTGTGFLGFRIGSVDAAVITNAGNMGIGTTTPNAPLQFANTAVNRKIVLYETANNDHQFLGLGINGSMLRYQVAQTTDNHAFFAGTSASTSTELMRIQGNGNVGIGTTTPNAPLQFANVNTARKIVLFEVANNNFQFMGIGLSTGTMRYQVAQTTDRHSFFAGSSSTTSNELMRIEGNGRVGIGTTAPGYKLDVADRMRVRQGASGSAGMWLFQTTPNTDRAFIGMLDDNTFGLFSAISGWGLTQNVNTGNVGIGTTSPGGQFELSLDQGRKPGTSTWTITSDERLKTIHGAYTKGLDEILQLSTITYNYKNVGERVFDEKVVETTQVGFSAQEVQKIFPEAVGTDEDGYLNFNMHVILVAYTNAIKELDQKIEAQEKINAELKLRLEKLESLLEKQ